MIEETLEERPKNNERKEKPSENTEQVKAQRDKQLETSPQKVPPKKAIDTVSEPFTQPPTIAKIQPEQKSLIKTPSFNVGAQLKNLRNKISDETMASAFEEYSQHRSLSGMHPDPQAVPRSTPKLSTEQEKELKTSHYSSELSITKLDNGSCSMTQDLSNVGMEGIKAVSYFSCGESAFDKAFRKHMKKVSDKTKPTQ